MEYYTIRGLYLGASLVYIVSQCSVSFHFDAPRKGCERVIGGAGASIYSGFTHNGHHHLILDSVIDPNERGRGEHLFWIHTQ